MSHVHSASWELVVEIDRHRRLANYQYIGLHNRGEVWHELRYMNEYLACVRHLGLYLHDEQMCDQAGENRPGSLPHPLVCLRLQPRRMLSLRVIQECLQTVRALRVLKLVVYFSSLELPSTEELRSRRDNEQHWRQRLARSTGDKILSELANSCPELTAVVIEMEDDRLVASRFESNLDSDGDEDENDDDDDTGWTMPKHDDATYAFIRSKQIDLHGITSTVGMAGETPMVKYYEPCSGILNLIGSYTSEH